MSAFRKPRYRVSTGENNWIFSHVPNGKVSTSYFLLKLDVRLYSLQTFQATRLHGAGSPAISFGTSKPSL